MTEKRQYAGTICGRQQNSITAYYIISRIISTMAAFRNSLLHADLYSRLCFITTLNQSFIIAQVISLVPLTLKPSEQFHFKCKEVKLSSLYRLFYLVVSRDIYCDVPET